MTQNENLAALSEAGVSVWLDDLSRERLRSGNLQELIDTTGIGIEAVVARVLAHVRENGCQAPSR